jgi:carbon dioxide concentrating mechanism protein CcmO
MERALGILEVRGMTALAAAVDAMPKAASLRLAGRHGIGSGWLTVVIEGATGDVQTAIAAGETEAAAHGDVITARVVPGVEPAAVASMPHGQARLDPVTGYEALGILETRGVAPLVAGADAMVKAADVELRGWAFIGGALVHAFVTGSVGDVDAAVAAGDAAARRVGEIHGTLVLPQPDPAVGVLFPPPPSAATSTAGALGVVETTGYVGSVGASDGMVKEAAIELVRLTIGSGGRVAAIVSGDLAPVGAAVTAGVEQARGVLCRRRGSGSASITGRPVAGSRRDANHGRSVEGARRDAEERRGRV